MPKKSFTPQKITERLHNKGMLFNDIEQAQHFFKTNPYYRFRGYFLDFINPNDTCPRHGKKFLETINFNQIKSRHDFDNTLRHILLEPIASVELALRAILVEILGQNSEYEYTEQSFYADSRSQRMYNQGRQKTYWDVWNEKLKTSKSLCPASVKRSYPHEIPIWAIIGHMDFGALEITISILKDEHFNKIKENFGYLNRQMFLNHIAYIRNLRNLCSHHEQLWQNDIKTEYQRRGNFPPIRIPWHQNYQPYNSQIYGIVLILLHCTKQSHANNWMHNLVNICQNAISSDDLSKGYGFPQKWEQQEFIQNIINP